MAVTIILSAAMSALIVLTTVYAIGKLAARCLRISLPAKNGCRLYETSGKWKAKNRPIRRDSFASDITPVENKITG